MMNNPLLNPNTLPEFNKIKSVQILPALRIVLAENRSRLRKLLRKNIFTWDNLITELDEMDNRIQTLWSPVEHLNAVINSPQLRKTYNQALPLLTQYQTELSHNEKLYAAIKKLTLSKNYTQLSTIQKRIIKKALIDFKLSGAELTGKAKKRFAAIQKRLAELTTKFEENLLDATNAWSHSVKQKKELTGLPDFTLQLAKQRAVAAKQKGWLLTLDFPTYYSIMQYADNASLRKIFYEAYTTRASERGPHNKKYDNSTIMLEILNLRTEMAKLLGFNNFAELSLETKMAKNSKEVLHFLEGLVTRAKPQAQQELQALTNFSKKYYAVNTLATWDIAYYTEKLRLHQFNISQEELRPYFPEPLVMQGLFTIAKRLYAIHIEPVAANTWHSDAKCYAIYNNTHDLIAYFYTDLYSRPNKRGGAWMGECRTRHFRPDGELQLPVAFLTCNFNQPTQGDPCLMTHDEVITLFHEFGHCLHHLLTKATYSTVSGINGVPWDAVELPSQFMENWCWQQEALKLISSHYKTKKALPKNLLNKMSKAKNFQAAMHLLRQLEFSLFDFRLHSSSKPQQDISVQELLDTVRSEVAVMQVPEFNRFQHSFSHIFAGGYAAGYYSYKWAEVLSSDAFSRFEEEGIFNHQTGQSFLKHILQRGGEQDIDKLFKKFRGRSPDIQHLLRHNGISI